MLNIENKFHEKLEQYYAQLPESLQEDCWQAFKNLRNQGRTYEWIYIAVSNKNVSHWKERGFGLLFTESYQHEIDKKIAEKTAKAAKAKVDKNEEQRYFEAYDKYYDIWWNQGKSFTERIPANSIPNELDIFNKNYNPDVNFHFYGPYQDNESGEWFYYFGTFEGYDKFRIRNGWEKPPQKATIYVDTYWDGEGRLVEKGKLWDIR